MNIKFESQFEKDLRHIKEANILSKLKKVLFECKESDTLRDITGLKKLKGYDNFYRIRIGDYRIGIEFSKGILIFTRLLHRKEIYKFFP